MFILGLVLAIFVGTTLGLVGSGGSILTVPIFVYVFGVDPVLATAYSLFAIGTTSTVGGFKGILHKEVDFDKLIKFGIPSMIAVFITRMYILPLIPDQFDIVGYIIEQEKVLMVLFAALMFVSAYGMLHDVSFKKKDGHPIILVVLQGLLIGGITGVVGAGGGFLIIPALINFFHLSMKKAVHTSLVLIAINSMLGLIGDWRRIQEFDWNLLLSYTGLTVIGIFVGFYFSNKIEGKRLKNTFAIMILLVAIFVLLEEFNWI